MLQPTTSEQIKTLVNTALGKIKADLVITNADLVNVYSGELLKGWSVAVKGERIAYVGENAEHTIGPSTRVIDASSKALVPGFIDGHTHIFAYYTVEEFLRYAMLGGTTTVITETLEFAYTLGYRGVKEQLEAISDQPIKIFATAPPMLSASPAALSNVLKTEEIRRLLKQKNVLGLGESSWYSVLQTEDRPIRLYTEAMNLGKTVEGHSAGAKDSKLAAYIASGVSSCHEPVNYEETIERLRLGLHTMIREGASRSDMEAIARIKDDPIDFRRLSLASDSIDAKRLIEDGYIEHAVQKAIDLGFDPIVAIQMATLNIAEHFSLDSHIGGIAPGKCADMVIIPGIRTIKAEMVISNGQIISQKGEVLVPPRKHTYSKWSRKSVNLPRKVRPADFRIPVEKGKPVTIRVINMVSETLSREEQITVTPKKDFLEADIEKDILKIAVIERKNEPGKMFTGFVKGFGMKKGAFASSATWDLSAIVVLGTNDEDMAEAANRVKELQGGMVIYAEGRVLAEVPLPIAGKVSDLPLETLLQQSEELQQKAAELGTTMPEIHLSLNALTTSAIPFFRICEAGLIDAKEGKIVGLFVP